MKLFTPEFWPVHVICVGMLAAAIIDWWKFKVPNKLTFPLIISGWLLGLANNCGLEAGEGGIGAAVFGTFLGCALLIPVYAIGGMGAGDVKMTMGFGSWMGAFYGLTRGLWIVLMAFCIAVIIGGVIALAMILIRGQFRKNLSNTKEIVGDLFTSASVGDVAGKASQRKPRMHLLPYGIPLCIGFVGYLVYVHL